MSSTPPIRHATPKPNLAARMGRWSAQHRWRAIGLWLAFVVLSVVIGGAVGLKTADDQGASTGDSARADAIVRAHFPKADGTESVLIQSRRAGGATSPQVRAAVAEVMRAVQGRKGVAHLRSPLAAGNAGQRSADGRSVTVEFDFHASAEQQAALIAPVEAAVHAVAAKHPELEIGQFGDASADRAVEKVFSDDFARAGKLSLPITLLVLIVAFGALVAAGIPLLLALTGVIATLGLVAIPSHVFALDPTVQSVVLLVGMAVGVDYSLFYLSREREERAKGASAEAALATAAATSGRSVMVSGFTVMAAMAGLLLAGDSTFTSLGIGSVLVVAVSMLGSMTVLPALLSALGGKVDRGRIPYLGRLRRPAQGSRIWGAILTRVLARPALSAALSLALLLVLAFPALRMHTANSGVESLPRSLPAMQVYDRMEAAFPGGEIPSTVVVRATDVTQPAVAGQIARLRALAVASPQMSEPVSIDVSRDHRVATIDIPTLGQGASAAGLRELRHSIIPATVGSLGGVDAYVTGKAADNQDFGDLMKARAPWVVGFVLALAFALLLLTFRSIVIPIKAILLNLLSVAASLGVLVTVFQDGHAQRLLGFESSGFITAWLPMFLFVILFGLSMDYHVFIISRIREAFDRGMTTDDAVAHGIRQTAGVVSSAAAVMVAVFAIFATLTMIDFKMMGVGLATAILIDATIVRGVLLPASMSLLGARNWYLPSWLQWLPDLGETTEAPEPIAPRQEPIAVG
jgi:RND superfamily putative drug exporter